MESGAFHLLDERIQRFIWAEGWESLRDIQEQAGPVVLAGDKDVVIAAATASGKTEAAFLPALTRLLQSDGGMGLIIYVSPLKALINDQFGRLDKLCDQLEVPVEFWPHHGSLSKEIRTETEAAVKQKEVPATAICTSTLELGIDIGAVKSVAQIGSPPSVASLRQRLGRSGRRKGEPAILRAYVEEDAITPQANWDTELRLETVETIPTSTSFT